MKASVRSAAAAAVSLLALCAAGTARAQAIDTSAPTFASDVVEDQLPDIVVTAQKRAESVQNVPISITAVTPARLQSSRIESVADLGKVAPGFATARSTQATNTKLYVRGIGGGGNFAVDPSVATFLDDAYVARPGAVIGNLFDVSGVEVLRGPQGTLFGRNASAGAVSIHTTAPGNDVSGYANAEYGSYGAYKLEGAVNVPVDDKVAVRIAGIASGIDGYATTSINPHRYGYSDTQGVRGTVRLDLTDAIRWTIRADYLHTSGDGQAQLEILPGTLSATAITNLTTRLSGNIPDITDAFDKRSRQIQDGQLTDRQYGVTSDLSIGLGDFTVRLLDSGRNWYNRQADADLIAMPIPILQRTALFGSDAQSHELQLISPDNRPLKFVGGLYYFRERFTAGEDYNLRPGWCGTIVPLVSPALVAPCLAGAQEGASIFRYDQVTNSYAAYGQATYTILPGVEFTAGGRYTQDIRNAKYDVNNYNGAIGFVRSEEHTLLHVKNDRFTYRLNLAYKPTPQVMLFGTMSTGYKGSAINSGTGTPALGQRRIVAPETVKNYELGLRSEWLDRRVTFNVTLFRDDVRGFQDRGYDGVSSVIRNAGDIRAQGVDLEASVRPTRHLSLSGGVEYLDSKFTDYRGAPGLPGFGGTQNLTGKSPTFTPTWQGNAAIDWDGRLGNGGWKYKLHSDVNFVSNANIGLTNDNNPQTVQKGYALLGAQASIVLPGDRLTLSIYGQNLTGHDYCTQIYNVILDSVFGLRNATTGGTGQRCVVGNPLTVGGRIGFKF